MNLGSLGLITPWINRLDLNGCSGCVRGLSGPTDVLLAVRKKIPVSGYLVVGPGGISNEERLAVNDALYELEVPSAFSMTATVGTQTVVGNPTSAAELKAQIDAALRKGGVEPPKDRPKWLIPAAIGGGVLLLGGIVLIARRK